MHFKRKKPHTRWLVIPGCPCCNPEIRREAAPLQMKMPDRKRFQSATAQLRCDATGSKTSLR